VSIKGLSGEALANATMKAETKAKRRLTLSLVGLGFLDESEIEGATADVDPTTGEIVERPKPRSLLESVEAQRAAMAQAPSGEADVDVVVEGQATEVSDEQPPADTTRTALSHEELKAELERIHVSVDYAAEKSKALFPRDEKTPLTDEQRAQLVAALEEEIATERSGSAQL
jgi:hypothetical protein